MRLVPLQALVVLIFWTWSVGRGQAGDLHQNGVAFLPTQQALVMSSGDFIIPLELHTDVLLQPLVDLNITADSLFWEVAAQESPTPDIRVLQSHLRRFQRQVHTRYKYMQGYLQGLLVDETVRTRRGIIAGIVTVASSLAGTLAQQGINTLVDRLKGDQMTSAQSRQLQVYERVLNSTVRDVSALDAAVQKINRVSQTTHEILRNNSLFGYQVASEVRMWGTVTTLRFALADVLGDQERIREGLNRLLEGYISRDMMTDKVLLQILKELTMRNPGLLLPAQPNFLPIYRRLSKIILLRRENKLLRFGVLLPLAGSPNTHFDIYKIRPFPTLINGTNTYMQIRPTHTYLAMSKDRLSYLLKDDFNECRTHSRLVLCSEPTPIYQYATPQCEANIFRGKVDLKLCRVEVMTSFPSQFLRLGNYYLFTTAEPLKFTISCPNDTPPYTKIIQHSGLLQLGSGCSATSERLTLPSYTPPERAPIVNKVQVTLQNITTADNFPVFAEIHNMDLPTPIDLLRRRDDRTTMGSTWSIVITILLAVVAIAGAAGGSYLLHTIRTNQELPWVVQSGGRSVETSSWEYETTENKKEERRLRREIRRKREEEMKRVKDAMRTRRHSRPPTPLMDVHPVKQQLSSVSEYSVPRVATPVMGSKAREQRLLVSQEYSVPRTREIFEMVDSA